MKKLPSPAMTVAIIALIFALAGTSYAAVKLPRNSVTSKQVKDRSLLAKDFKRGQADLEIATVQSQEIDLPPGGVTPESFEARCPQGSAVVGTGFYNSVATTAFVRSYETFVGGLIYNDSTATATKLHIQAICAYLPTGVVLARNEGGHAAFVRDRKGALPH